mgnify:FL=1
MFIEELTENQIKSFLEQEYPPEEGWSIIKSLEKIFV